MSLSLQATRLRKAFDIANALLYAGWRGRRALPVSLLEVGARGGLQTRWTLLYRTGCVRPIFVEADPDEARRLRDRYKRCSVLSCAAGDDSRPATLHVTRSDRRTSVLRPDFDRIWKYSQLGLPLDVAAYEIVEELSVQLEPLDSMLQQKDISVDYIKTDVQGFDLNVLQGLEKSLAGASNVMCEVQLIPVYENQAVFTTMTEWMLNHGFALIAFRPFSGRIYEGNAHFENLTLADPRSLLLRTLWRKIFGISDGNVNNSLSH